MSTQIDRTCKLLGFMSWAGFFHVHKYVEMLIIILIIISLNYTVVQLTNISAVLGVSSNIYFFCKLLNVLYNFNQHVLHWIAVHSFNLVDVFVLDTTVYIPSLVVYIYIYIYII